VSFFEYNGIYVISLFLKVSVSTRWHILEDKVTSFLLILEMLV